MSNDAGKSGVRRATEAAVSNTGIMAGGGAASATAIFGYLMDFAQKMYPDFGAWSELRNLGGAVVVFLVAGGAAHLARWARLQFVTLSRETDSIDKFMGGD